MEKQIHIWRETISVQQLSLTPINHENKNNNQRFCCCCCYKLFYLMLIIDLGSCCIKQEQLLMLYIDNYYKVMHYIINELSVSLGNCVQFPCDYIFY